MIPQLSGSLPMSTGNPAPSTPVSDIGAQKPAAPVELPGKAVKEVDARLDIGMVTKATDKINSLVQQFDQSVQFMVDPESGTQVVKVIDTKTKDIIRQIPTKEVLAIAMALDKLQGLLIKEKA